MLKWAGGDGRRQVPYLYASDDDASDTEMVAMAEALACLEAQPELIDYDWTFARFLNGQNTMPSAQT